MSSTTAKLGDLFIDATKEIIEKGRIKAQMNRLERIMETDRARLQTVYAQVGKLYMDGALAKNKGKLEYAIKEIKHLKLRLERAEERYEQLQEAHSVDECTEAFRTELSAKIKKAQDNTVIAAYKVKKKAQDVVKGKTSQPTVRIKSSALTSTDAIANRTAAIKSKKDAKDISFSELLEDLGIEDTDIDNLSEIELTPAECAEISAILENLDAELAEETAEENIEATAEAETTEEPTDGESAESFDF